MTEQTSARFGWPLIAPGQAQKEVTHNEALALADLTVQACVETVGDDAPPDAPAIGACWVTGAAPVGDWSGHAEALAGWTEGGWRFVAPRAGLSVWSRADATVARFDSDRWTIGEVVARRIVVGGAQVVAGQRAAIADPVGGSISDDPARDAIRAILAALRGHGLIAT